MDVRVTTQVVGHRFSYSVGAIVDQEKFAANVGVGWQAFVSPDDEEQAVQRPIVEQAVRRRGKR